jgi:hypothetical protein
MQHNAPLSDFRDAFRNSAKAFAENQKPKGRIFLKKLVDKNY